MTFKIGFAADRSVGKTDDSAYTQVPVATVPRKSVVQVKFPGRGASLASTIMISSICIPEIGCM